MIECPRCHTGVIHINAHVTVEVTTAMDSICIHYNPERNGPHEPQRISPVVGNVTSKKQLIRLLIQNLHGTTVN